jgi:hypothetical protein
MVREDKFNNIFPEFLYTGCTGINVLAFCHGSMAGRHGFDRAVFLQGHFNTADPAGSERIQIRGIAKRGDKTNICFPTDKRE